MRMKPYERIPRETIMWERYCVDEECHLCTKCDMSFREINDEVRTTQDEHSCKLRYSDGVEIMDNGGGYWVVKCPHFKEMDMRRLYKAYMKTAEWHMIASEAKEAAGYKCEICGSAINIEVHHTTYDHLCQEAKHPDDLLVVCKKCHRKLHETDLAERRHEGETD